MLTIPSGAESYLTWMGIDPGTDTMGLGFLDFDILTLGILRTDARTISGHRLAGQGTSIPTWLAEMHGKRFARIEALRNEVIRTAWQIRPYGIACESPFVNARFPQAGIALTEVVHALRSGVNEYDPWMEFSLFDPPSVKNAVGAKGNANKDQVREALLNFPGLNYVGEVPLEELDEHSIDALAVTICKHHHMLEQLCLRSNSS